ncbi:MAG: ribosome biogenesis/translation initiation ATPase RLI [Candidatus Diapherotrites archaeon]
MIKKENSEQIRIAVIDFKKCSSEKCNWLCFRFCPVNRLDKECIVKAEDLKPRISEKLCTACKICVHKCPFKAISIVNLSPKLGNAVHSYGQNKYRLYGLPVPSKGAVVGLIGRNGIGKTTALKILSGKLVPSIGEGKDYKPAIDFFKGSELQAYFTMLSQGALKSSFKPQDINSIPQAFKGSVKELLKKMDETARFSNAVKELELEKILNSEIHLISGGELQRVAIAAAMLKDADFYFFDEPSSYLDARERLRIAKIIRSLAEQGKYVMVVEHDLAVLDYLSDYIHVIFGEKGVFGVISGRMSARNGINQYLEGYLKSENIRFRDKEIKFHVSAPVESKEKPVLLEFPAFEKKFKSFHLEAEGGYMRKGEVLGVLGPNAIGKTTFVKVLAGVLKPDKGKIDLGFKVSYKPQYLKPEKEMSVREFFDLQKLDRVLFESEAMHRFSLNELMERDLGELSGGELQKVAVSAAMCRDASLVLLDEPSAFLDIEERLNAADFIRSVTNKKENACLVVDHDILFQDYLSDRLLVFEGTPAVKGKAIQPLPMREGMNRFLSSLGITYRRDPETGRPRANKQGSTKDEEQKKENKYYYG